MRRQLAKRASALLVGIPAMLASPQASAQQQQAVLDTPACHAAKAYMEAGRHAREKRLPGEAFDLFSKAHEQTDCKTPVPLLFMARAKRDAEQLLDARALYIEAVDYPDPNNLFREAKELAVKEYEELSPTIPCIKIMVAGLSKGPASVIVDHAPVPTGELAKKEVNPGPHTVEVVAPDGRRMKRPFKIEIRSNSTEPCTAHVFDFTVETAPEVPAPDPEPTPRVAPPHAEPVRAPPRDPRRHDPRPASPSYVSSGVAFGISGIGLTSAIVSGAFYAVQTRSSANLVPLGIATFGSTALAAGSALAGVILLPNRGGTSRAYSAPLPRLAVGLQPGLACLWGGF